MATLVLSTVGTVLGGPVGSAVGALIGQSIDQELLAPTRRGPRLGDLGVQTSSYGTQIPRVYGTMRVAGSVVWATDLVEHAQTGGAKGQPDVTYSYSVSLAVALSSRRASSIKRIWADGKLLRGAAGDLKVGGALRFYDGSEDQMIDAFIGSVEGIANTPAYRGLALAVFESLELADFGNRIPFLTFEIAADEEPPSVGSVLEDASSGVITVGTEDTVIGYAAYGANTRNALEPLVDSFGLELFDDGERLRGSTSAVPTVISREEFGSSADTRQPQRMQREQLSSRNVPGALRIAYYDPDRDYQTAEARAAAGELGGAEDRRELAAALDASQAKSLAQENLARAWLQRDKLTLGLPPKRLALEPGTKVSLPLSPAEWTVQKSSIDGFATLVELRPSTKRAGIMAADSGRIVSNADVVAGPLSLALIDVPDVLGASSSAPTLLIAATTATGGWKVRPLELSFGGQQVGTQTPRRKSLLGRAIGILAAGGANLIDDENSIEIALIDEGQWLTSCDDDALAAGQNLAVLGQELIQFGRAVPLGGGHFRLNHLLRGRGGTEWACVGHSADDVFCLVEADALQAIAIPTWNIGATVAASSPAGSSTSLFFAGESVRPPTPVNLSARLQPSGDLALAWTRRSRQGFAWVDGIDAPLGESREQYRILITGAAGELDSLADQPTLTVGGVELSTIGTGPASVEVRQIGDFAASRPAQIEIFLS